nr:hypothetical protein Iba_chr01aCG1880 [Ipomoea batatas]GMC48861.1 hypothetical protein Iba_chr01bCG2420 [Ipomoea batatas]GMC51015.1 hypothetical protein Iba_chr01cCG2280 [Ipomoea batatas]GMC56549.1 hypothetical protein Iba_chr01fCG8160 [Ipomoea batatas]
MEQYILECSGMLVGHQDHHHEDVKPYVGRQHESVHEMNLVLILLHSC